MQIWEQNFSIWKLNKLGNLMFCWPCIVIYCNDKVRKCKKYTICLKFLALWLAFVCLKSKSVSFPVKWRLSLKSGLFFSLDWARNRNSIYCKGFFFPNRNRVVCVAHPACCLIRTGVLSAGIRCAEREADRSHRVPALRKRSVLPPRLYTSFMRGVWLPVEAVVLYAFWACDWLTN